MDNQQKMDKCTGCFVVGLIVTGIDFFVCMNQDDVSGVLITAIIFIIGLIFCIISAILINIYNAKVKNMSAGEYLSDRFANAIPETRELFGRKDNNVSTITVKCQYCNSYNVKKISSINRVISIKLVGMASSKIGKQWHCNDCNSDF